MLLIGYCRVSSKTQEDNTSLLDQETKIRAYCELYNHELIGIYSDVGSGANCDRKGLKDCLAALSRCDGLIVFKLDRLSRSVKDTITLSDTLSRDKKELVSVSQQLDTSTASGRLFFNLMASFSEYERDVIKERTASGRKAKKEAGGRIGGKPPFGKRVDPENKDRFVDCPSELETINLIKRHNRCGKSLQRIADYLNSQNIPSRLGRKWYASSVKLVLDRAYPSKRKKPKSYQQPLA